MNIVQTFIYFLLKDGPADDFHVAPNGKKLYYIHDGKLVTVRADPHNFNDLTVVQVRRFVSEHRRSLQHS